MSLHNLHLRILFGKLKISRPFLIRIPNMIVFFRDTWPPSHHSKIKDEPIKDPLCNIDKLVERVTPERNPW